MKITFYTKISPLLVTVNYVLLVFSTFIILFVGFDIIDMIVHPVNAVLCLILFNLTIIIINKKKYNDDFSIMSYLMFVVIVPEIVIIISNFLLYLLTQMLFNLGLA